MNIISGSRISLSSTLFRVCRAGLDSQGNVAMVRRAWSCPRLCLLQQRRQFLLLVRGPSRPRIQILVQSAIIRRSSPWLRNMRWRILHRRFLLRLRANLKRKILFLTDAATRPVEPWRHAITPMARNDFHRWITIFAAPSTLRAAIFYLRPTTPVPSMPS